MLEIETGMEVKLPATIENIIPKLNEEQLRLLNRIIVEKLKLLSRAHHLKEMAKYNIGDIVSFKHHDKKKVGKIIRLHQKTVSIITENNERWNVAPSLLTLEEDQSFDLFKTDEVVEEKNVTPFQQPSEKISRNAPCPCGSGKKYKKCCGS